MSGLNLINASLNSDAGKFNTTDIKYNSSGLKKSNTDENDYGAYEEFDYEEFLKNHSTEEKKEEKKSGILSFLDKVGDFVEDVVSTGAVITTTVTSGLYSLGEDLVDGLAWTGGKVVEGTSWLAASTAGLFSKSAKDSILDWREDTKQVTKDFIATDHVAELNKSFYEGTKLGQMINDHSLLKYDSELATKVQTGTKVVGEVAAATALTVFTGGAAAPLAAGFLVGTGQSASKTYQNSTETSGVDEAKIFLNGVGEAVSWYGTGRLGASAVKAGSAIKNAGFNNFVHVLKGSFTSAVNTLKTEGLSAVFSKEALGKAFKATAHDVDTYVDSAAVVANNVTSWITGEEEFNLKNVGKATLELTGAFALNLGFNSLSNLMNMTPTVTQTQGTSSFNTYQFIDEYLANPNMVMPPEASPELVEYLQKYAFDPNVTAPGGIPKEVVEYIDFKAKQAVPTTPQITTTAQTPQVTTTTTTLQTQPVTTTTTHVFNDYDDFVAHYKIATEQWLQSLSDEEKKIIKAYIRENVEEIGNYKAVNGILRESLIDLDHQTVSWYGTGGVPKTKTIAEFEQMIGMPFTEWYKKQNDAIAALDDVIRRSTLDERTVLYRGVNWNIFESYGITSADSPDEIFAKLTKNGNIYCDKGFMSSSPTTKPWIVNSKPIHLVMNCDAGTPAANFNAYNSGEGEVLLSAGQKFIINGVQEFNGKIQIFLQTIK